METDKINKTNKEVYFMSYDSSLRWELLESVAEYCKEEDIENHKEILLYIYNTTTDEKLKNDIIDWFEENHYCIDCGEKLLQYEYYETHYELEDNYKEYFDAYLCPNCDYAEIKRNMYKEMY
jgi:uncharacterized protein with PIN domain